MSTIQNELKRLKFVQPDERPPVTQPPLVRHVPGFPAPPPSGDRLTSQYTYTDACRLCQGDDADALIALRDSVVEQLQRIQLQLEQSTLSRAESREWLLEQGYDGLDLERELADWSEVSWRRRAKGAASIFNQWMRIIKTRLRTLAPNGLAPAVRINQVFKGIGLSATLVVEVLNKIAAEGYAVQTYTTCGSDFVVTYYKK